MDVGDDREAARPRRLRAKPSSASARGMATRTISQPARARRAICASVASASRVSVLVIDCTVMGAPPPIGTPPTMHGARRHAALPRRSLPLGRASLTMYLTTSEYMR